MNEIIILIESRIKDIKKINQTDKYLNYMGK
jgi:hypothetical protein